MTETPRSRMPARVRLKWSARSSACFTKQAIDGKANTWLTGTWGTPCSHKCTQRITLPAARVRAIWARSCVQRNERFVVIFTTFQSATN